MRLRFLLFGLVGALIGWRDAPEARDESLREREVGSGRRTVGIQIAAAVEPDAPGVAALERAARADRAPRILGSSEAGYRSEGAHFYVWQPTRADLVSWLVELAPEARGAFRLPTDSADTAQS
jgi:hypothetical protein